MSSALLLILSSQSAVAPAFNPPSQSGPAATYGVAYSWTPTSSGATSFSLLPGAPSWMSINASTGTVSGTPDDVEGTYPFTIRATNSGPTTADLVTSVPITVVPSLITGNVANNLLDLDAGLATYQDSALTTLASADGDPVGGQKDQSGNNNHATQATSGLRGTLKLSQVNGKPVIRLSNASGQWLTLANNIGTAQSIFIVGKAISDIPNAVILGHPTLYDFARTSSTMLDAAFASSSLLGGSAWSNRNPWSPPNLLPIRTGNYTLWSFIASSNNVSFRYITNDRNAAGRTWDGDYAEIVVYNVALTAKQQKALEQYFVNKYALLGNVNFVADGDSITAGATGTSWVTQLMPILTARNQYTYAGDISLALGGKTVATIASSDLAAINAKYVANGNVRNIFALFAGTNDLYFGGDPATAYANIKTVWASAKAQGYDVLAFTVLPRSNSGTPGTFESDRQTLNTLIKSDPTLYYALVDGGSDSIMGDPAQTTNTTWYADRVHPTTAGELRLSNVAAAVLPNTY